MNCVSSWGRITRRSAFAGGALLCGLALSDGVGRSPHYVPLANAQDAAPNTAPADAGQVFMPMAYFAQNCARCHGPNGSFYGANFGKGLTDDKLRTVVHDMAVGPGNAPLSDHDLEIEVAYHRALIAKQPFIVVTEITEQDGIKTLHGEATPESALTLKVGQTEVPVKLEEITWEAVLPPQAALGDVTLTATQGEVKTVLSVGTKFWSHTTAVEEK